jgi:hypothetical protein
MTKDKKKENKSYTLDGDLIKKVKKDAEKQTKNLGMVVYESNIVNKILREHYGPEQ